MFLRRFGCKSDGGVDPTGWWWLPALGARPMPRVRRILVFCQCKAEKEKISHSYFLEMEGIMHRFSVTAGVHRTPTRWKVRTPMDRTMFYWVWLLGEGAEIRWNFDGTHAAHNRGRRGMWWRGKKLQSWPPLDDGFSSSFDFKTYQYKDRVDCLLPEVSTATCTSLTVVPSLLLQRIKSWFPCGPRLNFIALEVRKSRGTVD
ncbi:hypothetical protein FISHEDRAFT_59389 [Fistulina hepatica ATCC 64428]|uniref:Uncharacterized protein n=1 Tax=Fistulina hepatica ATCC 64428 TaxID=1128425 RepID=A0A0D7AAS9_9AGAR|nr:hypothetical protein FISHEDRAFT_59389 [Fistulina hepatica ATCC 64428]